MGDDPVTEFRDQEMAKMRVHAEWLSTSTATGSNVWTPTGRALYRILRPTFVLDWLDGRGNIAEIDSLRATLAAERAEGERLRDALELVQRSALTGAISMTVALREIRAVARTALARPSPTEHEHRYPQPNGQGFHPDQCLDCLEWK